MIQVMICWVLAMAAGLAWSRTWTALFTGLTALVFLITQGGSLAGGVGWAQLGILTITPWLLAAQQRSDEQVMKALHAEEAKGRSRLSQAARSLMSLQASIQEIEAQIGAISDVYHVTKDASGTLHLRELFDSTLRVAPRLLGIHGLRLIDLSEAAPRILRAVRTTDGRLVAEEGSGAGPVEELVIKRTLDTGQAGRATAQEIGQSLGAEVTHVAWAPLWRDQRPVGVLLAEQLPEAQRDMLSIIANQLSLQLSRIHLYQQVEQLAVTDALTGLFVRRHFMERAREELIRSKRHALSCTILMTDLDRFKQKNDTYGHLVGDVILKDVATLLKRNLREVDLIARYGGEEFILLLIETDPDQALVIAQRFRQLVEVHPIRAYDELLNQTLSIGVAGFPRHGETLEELIERADRALYAAKNAGRNAVHMASEPPAGPAGTGKAAKAKKA